MRIYELDVNKEKRICVDAEDLLDRMFALEMGNPNILENYWNIRVIVSQALIKARNDKESEVILPPPPPPMNQAQQPEKVMVIE